MKPPRRLQPPKLTPDEWRAISLSLSREAWLDVSFYDERKSASVKIRTYLHALADQSPPSP